MLGFAMRAGRVVIGTDLVCAAMAKRGKDKLKLALVSASASAATKKKITVKCEFYSIKALETDLPPEELGRLLGKTYAPVVVGITDEGFAREISLAIGSQT